MKNKKLLNLKEEYDQIEVPSELQDTIQRGIERGRKEMEEKNKSRKTTLKVCASFVIALTLFTGGINASLSFADTLKGIPVVGKLVEVLQFTDGKSSGGEITDGTDISNIDSIKEDGYENIVINFTQGEDIQKKVGAFKVAYEENPYTMTFEIGGARRISAKENFDKLLESKYIKDIYTIITLDDSLTRFVIEFEGPVKYKVKEMEDPASLVISLKADKDAVEKKVYSLRTKSYPWGEGLGHLEEKLASLKPTRMLKDEKGMYFIEIESFENKKDALSRMDEISNFDYADILIEERSGNESPKKYPLETQVKSKGESSDESLEESISNDSNTEESVLYPVSIENNEEYYYGDIEVLEEGLKLYRKDLDKKVESEDYFLYRDIELTKLHGEASYKLKIETDNKTIVVSGVFSDFFEELKKYSKVN